MADLTDRMRLTVLAYLLRSTIAVDRDGGMVTTWDRWCNMGIAVDDIVGEVEPFSAPPYSLAECELMRAVISGRPQP